MLAQKAEISLLNRLKLTGLGGVGVVLCLTLFTGVSPNLQQIQLTAKIDLTKLALLMCSCSSKVSTVLCDWISAGIGAYTSPVQGCG